MYRCLAATGKFKVPTSLSNSSGNSKESLAELAASLLRIEGEKIDVVSNAEAGHTEVISDSDLNMLLDRSPEVFEGRTKGWTSSGAGARDNIGEEKPKTAAFEVFEMNAGNGALDSMMNDVEDFEDALFEEQSATTLD